MVLLSSLELQAVTVIATVAVLQGYQIHHFTCRRPKYCKLTRDQPLSRVPEDTLRYDKYQESVPHL